MGTARLAGRRRAWFRKWLAPELAKLDAAGVRIVAFEAGNEINASPFNADFAAPALADHWNWRISTIPPIRRDAPSPPATGLI